MDLFSWNDARRGDCVMKRQKASFTIEAIILTALILCMMVGILQEGIRLYQVCEKRTVAQELELWDGVSRFYEFWILKELGEEETDE